MKIFLFAFLIRCSLPVVTFCKIYNISQYGSICEDGENTWTAGFQYQSIQAIVDCSNCTSEIKNLLWCEGVESCKAFAHISGDVQKNSYGLIGYSNWTLLNDTYLISKLQLFNAVDEFSKKLFSFALKEVSNPIPKYRTNITVRYCPKRNKNNLTSFHHENAYYGNVSNFICPTGEYLINMTDNITVSYATMTCGSCAQWEGIDEMDCWRAPNVSLNLTNVNKTFKVDDKLTSKICIIYDFGKPPAANPTLLLSKLSGKPPPLDLQAEHNNKSISCLMKNQLTEILGTDAVSSQEYKLSIQFGPTKVWNQTTCTLTDMELGLFNMTLNISFSANPPFGNVVLSGLGNASNFTEMLTNGSIGCCAVPVQNYTIVVTNVTSQDRITFLYQHQVKNYSGISSCADVILGTHPSVTTPVIIASSGGVLLIIAITILCVLIKRRRKLEASQLAPSQTSSPEGQGSEERLSVVYDTTDLRSSGNSGETVENVLYGSATRETDVYAAVVKPKKKSDAKPTDFYAEVVKIKEKDSIADVPSVSGLQSEATYAAVNKKQKSEKSGKQHKEVDESLQLDQTYAVVDKKRKKK